MGTGRNFKLKTGQNLGFQFGSKTQNRSKPTPKTARAYGEGSKTYQTRRKSWPESLRCREENREKNQSISWPDFELSGRDNRWVLIGTSRRVKRDWSRGLRWTVAAAARWFPFGLHSDGNGFDAEGGDTGERERESEG
ncbi:unnamed protein product [Prunus armeniaca]